MLSNFETNEKQKYNHKQNNKNYHHYNNKFLNSGIRG